MFYVLLPVDLVRSLLPRELDFMYNFQVIRELEMKRKKEVEQAMKELVSLREENQELKKKLDGARCRIRNLECDSTTIRQKMQTFMEKSSHDDLLINEQRVSDLILLN